MTWHIDLQIEGDSIEEIAEKVCKRDDITEVPSVFERELKKAQRAGFDVEEAAEILARRYHEDAPDPWIFDIYGVGTVRGCRLLEAGYDSLDKLASLSLEELQAIRGISYGFARVISEHAKELVGAREDTATQISLKSDVSRTRIEKDLSTLGATGVPPSEAHPVLVDLYTADSPRLLDIDGVDTRIAYFLTQSGYTSPEDIFEARTEDLLDINYIGEARVKKIQASASELLTRQDQQRARSSKTSTGRMGVDREGSEATHEGGEATDWPKRIVCIGSVDRTGVSAIETQLAEVDVDAIIYTGSHPPPPTEPDMDFQNTVEEIIETLSSLTSLGPIGFVVGQYSVVDPGIEALDEVETSGYATYSDWHYAAQMIPPAGFEHIPIDGVTEIGGIEVTQNPQLADEHTIQVTYSDGAAETANKPICRISGEGLFGYQDGDKLNTVSATFKTGNEGTPVLGGYHILEVSEREIESITFHSLGDAVAKQCRTHSSRGIQYLYRGLECPYCANNDVVPGTPGRSSLPHQTPTETTWQRYLIASDQTRTSGYEGEAYYQRHGSLRPRDTREVHIPNGPQAEVELDRNAIDTLALQGEWLMQHPPDEVDAIWNRIKELTEDGEIYDARVDTRLSTQLKNENEYEVGVTVPNYFDDDDVERVYELLDRTDTDLVFRPLIYNQLGITNSTKEQYGLDKITRYDDLSQSTTRP